MERYLDREGKGEEKECNCCLNLINEKFTTKVRGLIKGFDKCERNDDIDVSRDLLRESLKISNVVEADIASLRLCLRSIAPISDLRHVKTPSKIHSTYTRQLIVT